VLYHKTTIRSSKLTNQPSELHQLTTCLYLEKEHKWQNSSRSIILAIRVERVVRITVIRTTEGKLRAVGNTEIHCIIVIMK
jgi:hypothetical protein